MTLLCVLITVSMSKSRDSMMPAAAAGGCHPSCLLRILLTSGSYVITVIVWRGGGACSLPKFPDDHCYCAPSSSRTRNVAEKVFESSQSQSHQCSGHQNCCMLQKRFIGLLSPASPSVASCVFTPLWWWVLRFRFYKGHQRKSRLFIIF